MLPISPRNDIMTNAWSFLYDAMNEDKIDLTDGHYTDYMESFNYGNTVSNGDKIEFDIIPEMNLNLDSLSNNGFWKYEEDKTMKEIREYLSSTYKSHYTSKDSKTQTLDLIESIGDAEPFCRSNAIKYLSRFGKKNGKSKQDILKAIHYCILLYHFSGLHNETKGTYETF